MPLIQRPAQESDIPGLCDAFFSAFAKDLVMKACFPDVPEARAFCVDGLQKDIADPSHHVMCVVDTDLPQSPIIAYANWQDCTEDTIQEGPLCPKGGDLQVAESFFGRLRKRKVEVMGGKKYWYLACLCCHEAHQGRGAGTMLMKYGTELADKEGKEIYVEASPPGVPVYTRYGCKEVDRVVVLDGKYIELLLKRDGKKL